MQPTYCAMSARVASSMSGSAITSDRLKRPPGLSTRADLAQYVGCIAGALTHGEYTRYLTDAGLTDVEITETHRVHQHAASAIIRARKP